MALFKKGTTLLALAGTLLFVGLFIFRVKGEMADFEVNYRAGNRLWQGETLYRTADEHYQFKYSPASALLYLPLSALPLTAAKAVWYVLILVSIFASFYFSSKLADSSGGKGLTAVLISGAILARFFFRELQLGQINALIMALLVLMIWMLARVSPGMAIRRETWAGFLWGLATALKPYALIFFPYFLIKKKWRSLWPGLVLIAFSLFVPMIFYGLGGNMIVLREWVSSLSRSTPALLTSQDNVSLLAGLSKWTGQSDFALLLYAIGLGILTFSTLLIIRRGKKVAVPLVLDGALLLVLIPLVSPLGWDYTFLSSILAVALVVRDFSLFPKGIKVILAVNFLIVGLAIYDLWGRNLYAAFMSLSVPTINFLILIAGLFYLRAKGRR